MVTDSLIRKKFVHDTMAEGVESMYNAWQPAVAHFRERSGQLRAFAQSGAAAHKIENTAYELQLFVPLHLRFLDLQYRTHRGTKAKGKANLYNKLVWPILYKQVFPELKYGFTDEVRQQLGSQLRQAVK